jgi:O-antigen/teichoic acid export membrane protein
VTEARPGASEPNIASPGAVTARGHSLKRNALYAVLGNGVLNVCRFLVVVLLAKFTSSEIQGTFTYASIALAGPVVLFCGLELRAAFVADAGGEFTFGAYCTLRTLGMAVYWGVYQRRERLDLLAWSNALRGLTMLAPFLILLPLFASQGGSTAATFDHRMRVAACAVSIYVIAWAAVWWFVDRRHVVGHADVDLSWNWPALWRVAKQTLPLGLVFLLINSRETVIQSIVKHAAGPEGWADLGYFGAMRVITLGAMFLIVQVSTAAGNRLANTYQQDVRAFVRLGVKLTGIALAIGASALAGTWLFGEWFLRVVFTPEHARHHQEFLILMAGQAIVLLAAVFGSVTTHMRQFWIQVPVQLSVLLVTALAAVLLIGAENPVRGGAWTMLVAGITQAVLYLACVLIGIRWRDRIVGLR